MSSTFVLQKMLKEMSEVKWYHIEMQTYQRNEYIWNDNYIGNV